MNQYEHDFVIDYVDVDTHAVLSDWGFFKYLQEIACLHADQVGFGLNDIPKTGLAWILLDWKLQILRRPVWKDVIHIRTWATKMELATCYRDFEILDASGNRLAIATSKWVLYHLGQQKITRITPEMEAAFQPAPSSLFNMEISKLKEPASYSSSFEYTILRKDIDSNHHVNNLNYILLARESLPKEIFDLSFSEIDVMYKKQCLLGDVILCFYQKISETEYVVTIKSKDLKKLHAIVRFSTTT